ncbi:MAG TPA: pyruvate kinase [Actinomycetota bacterium]|jgi:pyruvate kinase|nr:pyruvate kinase [Actinomycetota bacterium]
MRGERTKVVATLGPVSSNPETLKGMIEAGLDVVRLNFSHGERADHLARFELVRSVAADVGHNLAVLVDLQGPKIRVGVVDDNGVRVDRGRDVVLVAGADRAAEPEIPVVYPELAADVRQGDRILLDDGAIGLRVQEVEGERVRCQVERGGVVRSRKGVNLPGVAVSATALTSKDRADVATAVEAGADYVALSFVRRPDDVVQAKQAIADHGGDIPVVAKLERPEAIGCLDEILEVADAVMVARGDLGVELAVEKVPPIQKHIIAQANSQGVPVITATQMLESMVASSRPTRAEASDVANAIFDGTDAVMLSQETAIGQYPVEAVATMARIAREAEATPYLSAPPPPAVGKLDVPATVSRAAVQVAADLGARAIVAFTESGATARYVSRFRPRTPILGLTPSETTRRRMALFWGVETAAPLPMGTQVRGMIDEADIRVVQEGLLEEGDLVVVVAGSPGGRGGTNRVLVHRVGRPDLAARG